MKFINFVAYNDNNSHKNHNIMKHSNTSFLRHAFIIVLLFAGQALFTSALAGTRVSATPGASYQRGSYLITITGNNVIGRDGPNGYDLGYRFNRGTRLTCVGASSGWYQCRVDNRYVWVSSRYAKRAGTVSSNNNVNSTVVTIIGDRVIGRATPGGVDTGKRFYKGQRLTCVGSNGSWWKVVSGGKYYWVSKSYAYIN